MQKILKTHGLMFTLAALLFLWACNTAPEPVRVSIISTNDFHGRIDGGSDSDLGYRAHGGFGWILGYFNAVRQDNPDGVILVDGGDLWQGTLLSNMTKGQAVIDLYNTAGYDAVALGNHEFDFGNGGGESSDLRHVLKERLKEAHFPMLAANVITIEDRKPLELPNFKPYTIIERKGVKVGIIGLATPNTRQTTLTKNIKDLDFTEPAAAVMRYSAILRQKGAQAVVVLTHLGATWDKEKQEWSGELVDLIKEVGSEIDLAVGAHTHTIISERINGVPMMSAGFYGRSFTRADLLIDSRKKGRDALLGVELEGATFFFRKSTSEAPPTYHGRPVKRDSSFDAKYAEYYKKVAAIVDEVYGEVPVEISREGDYDTPMGRLVADALLAAAPKADLAMTNRGGVRTGLNAGKITYGDIFKVIPFDNELMVVNLSGQQIITALEHGLNTYYWPLEIAGIIVIFDKSPGGDSRVKKIILRDGSLLAPASSYRVATNDFLFGGGDGYGAFTGGSGEHTNIPLREALARYLRSHSPIVAPEEARYIVANP